MVKFPWFAGGAMSPDPEIKWITGELPKHDYSAGGTGAVRKSNWFVSDQPDNDLSREGFIHFRAKNSNKSKIYNGYTNRHPWNDLSSIGTQTDTIKGFMVEFQQ